MTAERIIASMVATVGSITKILKRRLAIPLSFLFIAVVETSTAQSVASFGNKKAVGSFVNVALTVRDVHNARSGSSFSLSPASINVTSATFLDKPPNSM